MPNNNQTNSKQVLPANENAGSNRGSNVGGTPKTQTPPVRTAPVQTPRTQTPPVRTAPVQTPPAQTAEVKTAPAQTAEVKTAPVQTPPSTPAPKVEEPKVETPVEEPKKVEEKVFDSKTPLGADIVDAQIDGLGLSGDALITKQKLASEEKVTFMIPFDPGEKPGDYRVVIINGYRTEIKKGILMPMPKTIAKVLMESMNVTMQALTGHQNNLDSADTEKKKALDLA